MKHKYPLILIVVNFFTFANSYVYISSIDELSSIPSIIMPYIDNEEQIAKDEKPSFGEGIPLKYAEMTEVYLTTENSGEWLRHNDDYNVWRLNIVSFGAIGLKLLFNQFQLNENEIVYIYNEEQDMAVGPLTYRDNNIDNTFGHRLIKGESIYIEYFSPIENSSQHQLQISHVIHAYRDIHGYYETRDRDCGENVACSGADQ